MDALLGHSGFVGGNLLRQTVFDHLYRSTNIGELAGRRYRRIVCAAAPAEKWKANRDPEADRAGLERLTDALGRCEAEEVVLISTVDVFGMPIGIDESTPVDPAAATAYGRHRFGLEAFVRNRFRTLVVRLPALFGPGLKKNVVHDLLHGNQVERIHPLARFQFYDLNRLWSDVGIARAAGLDLVHLTTEPVQVADVSECLGGPRLAAPESVPAAYDFRTRHAGLFGGTGHYLETADRVLAGIAAFGVRERRRCA